MAIVAKGDMGRCERGLKGRWSLVYLTYWQGSAHVDWT